VSREVPEWIGKTDDTPLPARVKLRIFDKYVGHCNDCGMRIAGGVLPAYDHIIALANGGENRENNFQLL
jgi:5-methylcytosine-specific restriction protein A